MLRVTSIASFITVCLNTPKTIRGGEVMKLNYVITVVDMITFVLFVGEMLAKIHARGLIKVRNQNTQSNLYNPIGQCTKGNLARLTQYGRRGDETQLCHYCCRHDHVCAVCW